MSDKKKKGVGLIASGVAFIIAGIFTGFAANAPAALPQIFAIVALVLNALGIAFVIPKDE